MNAPDDDDDPNDLVCCGLGGVVVDVILESNADAIFDTENASFGFPLSLEFILFRCFWVHAEWSAFLVTVVVDDDALTAIDDVEEAAGFEYIIAPRVPPCVL